MLGSHVVVLMDVFCQVVEVGNTLLYHHLPVAHAETNLVGFVELPVEEVVCLLCLVISQQGRGERDAVEAVTFQFLVQVLLGEALVAHQFAEGRHDVVESQLMVVYLTGFHLSRPAYDERDADTSFVALAFQAAQLAVASEECRVGTAFFVRTVVTAEDDDGILVEPFFFQLGQDFAHVGIQSADHAGKLGMCVHALVVTGTGLSAPGLVFKELFLIFLQDRVVGLYQFGMRQGVRQEAVERLFAVLLVEPFQCLLVNQVSRILRTLEIVFAAHRVADVVFQNHAADGRITCGTAVGVQEVRVVEVRLKLAHVAEVFVHAPLVGSRGRTLVAAGPFAEHPGGIAVLLHDFRQDDMLWVIRLLSGHGILLVLSVPHLAEPVFLVASHVSVSAVLSGHDGGARRGTDGASGVCLRKSHALLCHLVDAGCLDERLAVASQVAVSHVVAENEQDVGFFRIGRCSLCMRCSHGNQSHTVG